jgi:hypothetical protein
MKITAAIWALLPAATQAAFKKVDGADEYDNGEEAVDGLKSALQKEKEEKAALGSKLASFETAKAAEIEAARKKALEEARTTGDFAAIEKDYQRQLKELKDGMAKAAKDAEDRTKADAVSKHVEDIAKLFTSPALAKAFIASRLTAEIVDGEPIVRVLSKDGKASAASVEDLKKEYLTDADLKGSLVASKGSGGGSTRSTSGGGSTGASDEKFDAANADPKTMIARLESKGVVSGDDD